MMDMHEKREKLQEYLREPGCTPIMCAYDVLSAKLIENAGFPIVYTGSFITGASQFGMADVGLVQLKDLLPLAREIAKEVDLPIIADVDNGWYHAGNIWRMIHEFEYAGISGIQVEDGIIGKHVGGEPIDMSKEVMCDHIRAMVDARTDKNFMIIARTDALWLKNDWEETIDRCNAYLEAGADACFITFAGSIKELKEYRDRINGLLSQQPFILRILLRRKQKPELICPVIGRQHYMLRSRRLEQPWKNSKKHRISQKLIMISKNMKSWTFFHMINTTEIWKNSTARISINNSYK